MHVCYLPNELGLRRPVFDHVVTVQNPRNGTPQRVSRRQENSAVLCAHLAVAGTRFLTGLQAQWVGCEPQDVQRIYFANHTSHMDFVLLWSVLPAFLREKTRPVAAADYWNRGTVRPYLIHQVFRGVVIDRNCSDKTANPLADLIEALDHGESLILFPEGTRGNGATVQPFKCGVFHLAKARPHVELVPVWIDNAYRVMPKGTPVPIPLLCSVSFGQPTHLAPDETKEDFLRRLRSNMQGVSKQ